MREGWCRVQYVCYIFLLSNLGTKKLKTLDTILSFNHRESQELEGDGSWMINWQLGGVETLSCFRFLQEKGIMEKNI